MDEDLRQDVVPTRSRRRELFGWLGTLGGLAALGAWLWLSAPPSMASTAAARPVVVQVATDGTIRVPADGPFAASLRRQVLAPQPTTFPLVEAIGTLVAASEAVDGGMRWRFAQPELLSLHTELGQLAHEIEFHRQHTEAIVALGAARVQAQQALVDRQRRLVESGADTARDLAISEAELLERKLTADRTRHEADSELRAVERRRLAVVQQFEQAGLSPELLTAGAQLVVAEIPEVHATLVRAGQCCSLRFFAEPGRDHVGTLLRVMPTLAVAQHTVRVVVALRQPDPVLRAGMFADVDLGIDERQALFVPATALVHVGRADYVLVGAGTDLRVVAVQLGEAHDGQVEITAGLAAGDTVVGDGALLLKPQVARALAVTGAAR